MLRRSTRCQAASYDANGRDYLAGELELSRSNLEAWLHSSTVGPHLQFWYNLCVLGRRRYNDAAEWLKIGEKGYFYDDQGLESDLLLSCLGEGNIEGIASKIGVFANANVKTSQWPTEQLWARTAWRIVQHNSGQGQIFAKAIIAHPASAYALAIDILCIAFHSIAYRHADSVWHELITNASPASTPTTTTEVELDRHSDTWSEEMASRIEVDAVSLSDSDGTCEGADSNFIAPQTPGRSGVEYIATPNAPRKVLASAADGVRVREWVDSL